MLKQFLYRHQGHISAALVLGGVDKDGPHLYSIYPHGSVDTLPYVTMGNSPYALVGDNFFFLLSKNLIQLYKDYISYEEVVSLVYF